MALYIDVMFVREMLVDGSVLLVTAWTRSVRARPLRVLAAAAIGASYVVLMLFPPLSILFTVIVKVLISLLMVAVAFGYTDLRGYTRHVAAFYAVNFTAAGAIIGIHYLLMQGSDELWKTITYVNGIMIVELKMGLVFFFSVFCIGLYVYRSVLTQRREKALVLSHLAEVTVTIEGRVHTCVGLIDTGNQLYDPLTRTPVMVMEAEVWKEELPASWLQRIRDSEVDRLIAGMGEEPFVWQDRLRLVPYRGVNKGSQFMLAMKPDTVQIEREGRTIQSSRVLIGLDGGKLVADGAYQAIIHPSLVQ
ncbi:peptidase [Paenibacillus beijingensis]|uniref:Sporulation sigma-E factor-processing peptidase n=1 Tax=Paenibacillus beijingensis TaxID=1126833 RepID=A0A0D5NRE8_9BACL|nr:sigma-E processing peptidase SpoIIGA [Paenibacillus beijingensis]AJY77861.1 peptidase [Paenibacillus beijingensis]